MKGKLWLTIVFSFALVGCAGAAGGKISPTLSIDEIRAMAKQTVAAQDGQNHSGEILLEPVLSTSDSSQLITHPTGSSIQIISTPTSAAMMIPTTPPILSIPTQAPTVNYVQPVAPVCDRMRFVDDVTIPDDTVMQPGQPFRKTWRIQNSGSCTWSQGYQLVFASGDQMGVNTAVNLPSAVPPNTTIDVSIDLTAPVNPGMYQSNWKLRNQYGALFGTANQQNDSIWAKIIVNASPSVITLTPNSTIPNTGCYILSMNPAYRASFNRGEETDFSFTIQNTTTATWNVESYDIAYVGGENMLKRKDQIRRDIPYNVAPGGTLSFTMDAIVPGDVGVYTMTVGIVSGFEVLCSANFTVNVVN